ncbi:chromosomal replication initiator protein DnaA [Clostridiaceae bacterium OttesenSCG-928-D20]|nr:chromosomal replication initiator protein DnaA [Clostridiaceae bacterium OttesenSCG-928-D20]
MNSLTELWEHVLSKIGESVTPTAMYTWFSDSQPVEITGSKLVIYTPKDFKRDLILSRFADGIKSVLSDIFSCEFDLVVLSEGELEIYKPADADEDSNLPEMEDFTFERFIVGDSNKYAHAAAVAVSENPGNVFNPLFIYGNSGLGKTHLLFAIGKRLKTLRPTSKIAYVKGDDFTNSMVKSIKEGTGEDFRNKYRNVDLFLIDDIQFIAGKMGVQEEFFHTFNTLYEAGKQIVLTSDRPPMEISRLEDRLRTRFEGGLLADIQPPNFETRMAIITNKAQKLGLNLSNDVVEYIAKEVSANIRQIEGVVKRLTAYNDMLYIEITQEVVKRAIKDVINVGIYIPTPAVIIEETAKFYSLKSADLKSQRRTKHLTEARQVAMYLIRTLTNTSLVDIGKEFGDRNHATVLSSIRKIEEMISEPHMAGIIRDISSNINSKI